MLGSLAMATALSNALVWMPPTTEYWEWHPLSRVEHQPTRAVESSPSWTATTDSYDLKVRLPEMEPHSVSASLASDGNHIEVVGERKIEGCSCRPSIVEQIRLPYRPRAEDISVIMKDDLLSLKLTRHAKEDGPTPLKVTVSEPPKPADDDASAEAGTRPLRFVPHQSAVEKPSVEAQERTLTDKFRTAALATLAAAPSSGVQEVANTKTAEAAAADTAGEAAKPAA